MNISISSDAVEMGRQAASLISWKINEILRRNGEARMAVSTGSSQFEMFEALLKEKVNWSKVEVFHLDEYIGIPITHKASFRKYLKERFIDHISLKKFHSVDADFDTRDAYIIVNLGDQCKMQQVGEGWFETINDVPDQAVSMSVWQIMQCRTIMSVIPHLVKADAVYKTLTNKLTTAVPATMLKKHPDWHLFLDNNSASKVISF
jgi:glucosamine-6-phosphate deaminase